MNIADETLTDNTAFSVGITILNQRTILKEDIEFVTEFPCLLGHSVVLSHLKIKKCIQTMINNWIISLLSESQTLVWDSA